MSRYEALLKRRWERIVYRRAEGTDVQAALNVENVQNKCLCPADGSFPVQGRKTFRAATNSVNRWPTFIDFRGLKALDADRKFKHAMKLSWIRLLGFAPASKFQKLLSQDCTHLTLNPCNPRLKSVGYSGLSGMAIARPRAVMGGNITWIHRRSPWI